MALAFILMSAVQPVQRLDVPQFLLEVEQVQTDAAEAGRETSMFKGRTWL